MTTTHNTSPYAGGYWSNSVRSHTFTTGAVFATTLRATPHLDWIYLSETDSRVGAQSLAKMVKIPDHESPAVYMRDLWTDPSWKWKRMGCHNKTVSR